jgi:hypothetical protein
MYTCPHCGELHDLNALEPSFRRPDEFLVLVRRDDVEIIDDKDACAVRSTDGSWERYFIRVLIPFTVETEPAPLSWGAWVEISAEMWQRVGQLWNDPKQNEEPPFGARFANDIPFYEGTLQIGGLVSLTSPDNVPTFHMTHPPDHLLVKEQLAGVSIARAAEWLQVVYHPEVIIQRKIDKLLQEEATGA